MCDLSEITREETLVQIKHVEWKIYDFMKITEQDQGFHASSLFSFLGSSWYLKMYTNRWNNRWVTMFLFSAEAVSYPVTFTFRMTYLEKQIAQITLTNNFDKQNSGYGNLCFCARETIEELGRNASKIALIVYCDLEYRKQLVVNTARQTSLCSSTVLHRDFQDFLASGRQSDVTIEVRGQQFKAHKLILEAHSPVFAAMFDHDLSEKKKCIVNIEDCDPAVFQEFLQCMYSVNMENISSENVTSLYTTANKYCVTNIKEACAQFMTKEMAVNNVCDVLVLADRYSDVELKKCAEEFLIQNVKIVLPTNQWKSFVSQNFLMSFKILVKVVDGDFYEKVEKQNIFINYQ